MPPASVAPAALPGASASTAPAAPAAAMPPANRLVTGPILPTLLRLAVPNVLSMTMAVLVGIAETYYIGLLGIEPLAAMALVFPFAMLTGMMSGGAMGGGVSSAISCALGAGNVPRATTLAQHAAVIGTGVGAVYTMLILVFGPTLYQLLGGRGTVLGHAIGYANVLFCGAILVWMMNCLAAILRGTGARGLRAIMEEVLQPVMFDIPSRDDVAKVVVTKETVQDNVLPTIVPRKAPRSERRDKSA